MRTIPPARRTPAWPLTLLLALAACRSTSPAVEPDRAVPLAPPAEESVRPGANDRFLDPALEVEEFVERFEGESREIAVHRDAILATLELVPGERVADVGAGTGLFLAPLSRAVGPTGEVHALDIAPRFVEHLAERIGAEGLSNARAAQCGERSVDLPEASVDAVLVCDTYHHFEYPRSTLASLRHALVPGGRLVVVDFERIPGVSREWLLEHVRAGKETFRAEIEEAGFVLVDEPAVEGLEENYVLCFRRP